MRCSMIERSARIRTCRLSIWCGATTTTAPAGVRYLARRDPATRCRRMQPPRVATDLSDLPEAYIDVGDLDILRDENIDYARRLMAAGVATELHVLPGLPHGFEMVAPDANATQRVITNRLRRLTNL